MILDNYNKKISNKYIESFKLTEDSIAMFTKMTSKLNGGSSNVNEYYDYIDNVINYFSDRQVAILALGRRQIDVIYTNRKQVMRNLDKMKYPIEVRKPNFKYHKIPMIDKMIYHDSITKWNYDNNDKVYLYANIYSPVYNGITKMLTNGEIKAVGDISKLYDIITDTVTIKDSKEMGDYLSNISIPREDLDYINKFIDTVISSLKDLKTKSVSDFGNDSIDFNSKVVFAMKMVDIKTTYVKNIVNILLDIYLVKINLCSFNGISDIVVNTSINEMFVDRSIYNESIVYLNEGFDKELYDKVADVSNTCKCEQLKIIKEYVDAMYRTTISIMDKYYRYDMLEYLEMYNISNEIDKYNDIDSIKDYKNYIETNINLDIDYRPTTFLDLKEVNDRALLINRINKKDIIVASLTNNYNKIISYIEQLSNSKSVYGSKLFDRYYHELPIYVKDDMDNISAFLKEKYDITIYSGFPYPLDEKTEFYRSIDNKYGHNVEIITLLEKYIKLRNQYCKMFCLVLDEIKGKYEPSLYIDDKLFAMVLFFQKQILATSI